jgi:hypothetical protein
MTKEEVRQFFGEPEKVSLSGEFESWDYGDGSISFDLDGGPGGQLYSWDEPSKSSSTTPATRAEPDGRPKAWQDKQAWRRLLRLGMTKQEVREVFGEPDSIYMYSLNEVWNYGRGDVWFSGKEDPATRVVNQWREPVD